MENIVVYATKYGSSKIYADELAKRLGVDSISYKDVKSISDFKTIIYFGSLYAGNILGLSKFVKKYPISKNQKLIIVTVGLTDPSDEKGMDIINQAIEKRIDKEILKNTTKFHLRGCVDLNKLNFFYKIIMKAIYNNSKKNPNSDQAMDLDDLFESEEHKVNYINLDGLDIIVDSSQI